MRFRLVYGTHTPGLGRARVFYCPRLREYRVRLECTFDQSRDGEYFTDDRTDALATVQAMMISLERARAELEL